jgi:riboflavin synthase
MFTGLIEEIGRVQKIVLHGSSAVLTIAADKVLGDVKLGDSICTNGVCLTVVDFSKAHFSVDIMPESLSRSNLGRLKSGDAVNLERALRLGDRLGGHLVSGHIDASCQISDIRTDANATWYTIQAEPSVLKYIIEKGSVAIDGISLTVAYADMTCFKVSIIPHTSSQTTLKMKKTGDFINVECDAFGKYVERIATFTAQAEKKETITMALLSQSGFLER